MKILRFLTPLFLFAATAFGQVVLQQPPGTYTDNSIPVRDGTSNKIKNASTLLFTTSANPGSPNRTLQIGSNVGDSQLLIVGGSAAGNTANSFNFELHDAGDALTQAWVNTFDLGLSRWSTSYWSTLSSAYVEQSHFDPATNVTTFTNGLSAPVLTSTVATGTAPFVVASTTLVTNLHAATADSSTSTTTATNATNTAITDDTTTSATMYPTWVTAATGNLPQKVSSTKMTFNPSTATLTVANLSGNASTATSATSSTTATNSTNIGITDDTTTNASMFPLWATANTGNLPAKVSSTKLFFNPSTGLLTTPSLTLTSTTSLLLGTAGSAVGNIGFRNATSGTATLAPPTGALGTYSVTLPNAASTLPIFGQQITFSGPTAARTITLLDTAYTTARQDAAQTFTGVQSFTSPDFTTSVTTPSTSFTAFAGATTLMTIGGTGASASSFFPSTLDTSSSITGAIRTSGGISAAKALNIGTTITGGGNLSIGTSNSATVGTIELGAATDTTLARVSAGVISVEGSTVFQGNTKADVLEAAIFAADAGASDTYAITLSPAITTYVTGAHYWFKANTANTGAATININALGAKTIVKAAGGITTALADNDIRAGQWVDLVYDGTNMQMQSLLGNSATGTVSVVSAGSLTSTALVTGGGTTTVQTPSATATMDASGNISTPGTLTVGNAATTAGAIALTQGTTQSAGTTNITIQAPTSVTSYIRTLPGAAATGFYLGTNSAGVVTDTQVASTGSGSVVLATSPDFTTSVTTASTSFTAWAGATTLLTLGGTGASASTFMPSTLDATSSTTGAIRTSGGISAAKALNIGTTITGGGALSIGTSNAATVGTVELGAATDTTLSRSAAGVIAVEGNIVSMVGPRLTTITSNANPTFDVRTCDIVNITAQAADITSMTTNMTITGVLDGQQLEFRILGTAARAITWGANFASGIATLPTTTTTTKTLYAYFEYDAVQAKFMLQATGSYP